MIGKIFEFLTFPGFKFGNSSEINSKNEENNKTSPKKDMEYSREFLSHLKQLNKQVTAWLKTHVDKNPYVFLSPVFKDYERHLKDLEKVRKKYIFTFYPSDVKIVISIFFRNSSH